jgi:putative transposase
MFASQVPDAETALRLIDGWIEDYKKSIHIPRSRWLPWQFIKAKST